MLTMEVVVVSWPMWLRFFCKGKIQVCNSNNNNDDDDDDDENTIVMESIAVGGQNVVGLVGSTATASSIKPSKRLLLGRKMSRSLSNTDF